MKFKLPSYCYARSCLHDGPIEFRNLRTFLNDLEAVPDQDRTAINGANVRDAYHKYCDRVATINPTRAQQLRSDLESHETQELLAQHGLRGESKQFLERVPAHFFDPQNPSFVSFKKKLDAANPGRKLVDRDYEQSLKTEEEMLLRLPYAYSCRKLKKLKKLQEDRKRFFTSEAPEWRGTSTEVS